MTGLFGTFDYDDWLATYEDHEVIFQGDEDEVYDSWIDDLLVRERL